MTGIFKAAASEDEAFAQIEAELAQLSAPAEPVSEPGVEIPERAVEVAPEASALPATEAPPQAPHAEPEQGFTVPPGFLDVAASEATIRALGTPQEDRRQPTAYAAEANSLPVSLPPGMTAMHPAQKPVAVQVLASVFPSMNEMGVLIDTRDRVAYSMSVMANQELRSDLKAQLVNKTMRDGQIVPEALGREWYGARNLQIIPPDVPIEGL